MSNNLLDLGLLDMWKHLTKTVISVRDKYVPETKKNISGLRKPVWLKSKLLHKIEMKNRKWQHFLENPTKESEMEYKKYSNEITDEIRAAKNDFGSLLIFSASFDSYSILAALISSLISLLYFLYSIFLILTYIVIHSAV